MKGWILSGLMFFVVSVTQAAKPFKCYLPDVVSKRDIDLKFSEKAEKFVKPTQYAAAAFPELNGKYIEIRRKKIGTLMAARPKADFFFRKKENRKYVIYITDSPDMNAGLVFDDMSECAQAGVLGHEFSHILDYNTKNNFEMLWFGIKYMFKRKQIEAETDLTAMKRGFADHLLEYTDYVHTCPHINKKYLHKKKKHYLGTVDMRKQYFASFQAIN